MALACIRRLANGAGMAKNRIREVRKSKQVTLEELEELTGISTSFLSRIEAGTRQLRLENAVRIARALKCDVADITDEFHSDDLHAAENLEISNEPRSSGGDIQSLTIHAGMGNGGLQIIEGVDGSGKIPAEFRDGFWSFLDPVRERFRNIRKTHALPVIGDSMAPTLIDGAVVFVDTTHTFPSPPDLYVLDYGDGLMVKRVELIPRSSKIRITSDNERYGSHEMPRREVHVFGRVIAWFQWRG